MNFQELSVNFFLLIYSAKRRSSSEKQFISILRFHLVSLTFKRMQCHKLNEISTSYTFIQSITKLLYENTEGNKSFHFLHSIIYFSMFSLNLQIFVFIQGKCLRIVNNNKSLELRVYTFMKHYSLYPARAY